MTWEEIKEYIHSTVAKMRNQPNHFPRLKKNKNQRFFPGKENKVWNTVFNTSSGKIYLGDYVFFGHNCVVATGTHDYTKTMLERQIAIPTEGRDIHIEDGVWIASNVTILGPCRIGKHSVVGAGAVVLPGEYPERSLLVGNPARVKKTIDTTLIFKV